MPLLWRSSNARLWLATELRVSGRTSSACSACVFCSVEQYADYSLPSKDSFSSGHLLDRLGHVPVACPRLMRHMNSSRSATEGVFACWSRLRNAVQTHFNFGPFLLAGWCPVSLA